MSHSRHIAKTALKIMRAHAPASRTVAAAAAAAGNPSPLLHLDACRHGSKSSARGAAA
jgi:hypothetical protein